MTEGYTGIHVKKELYERFKTLALARNKTNPDFLEYLLTLVPNEPNKKGNLQGAAPNNPDSTPSKDASLQSWVKQYEQDTKRESKRQS